jgi:tRNA(Met) C34 N-acetyltransferase TmcA
VPSQGYATIGLKPAILTRLQKDTDEFYPGMFLPSALIIMMNEVKRGFYSVEMHNMRVDFSGRYTSLTIRSDVKVWLEENYEKLKEDYDRKYKANSFTHFAAIFMLNVFESKAAAQNNIVRLKEADFRWLVEEYGKRKQEYKAKYGVQTFEQFADVFLKELLEKVNAAKKILSF